MSTRKITAKINSLLEKRNERDKRNKPLKVCHKTISNYLREFYGKPRSLRKVFYLSEEQKKKRLKFCEMILEKQINSQVIMFTDECRFDLGTYTRDVIRLDGEMKNQLLMGDEEAHNLLVRPVRKYESSVMIAGGISYHGLSRIVFLEGTMNNFAYGQTLLFFKEDIESLENKLGLDIILEQDGAPSHRSKSNLHLLNKLFNENGWIQNPPNSPDLAYPIENLWAILKPRVKNRGPKNIEELKKIILEEWNSVPIELIHKLCDGYIWRIKKVIELGGRRLEKEHLKKHNAIKKEYLWNLPFNLPNMRIAYNDQQIYKIRMKEIKRLKRQLKDWEADSNKKIKAKKKTKKQFKKKDLKNLSIGRVLSIINGPEKAKEEKIQRSNEIKNKIDKIQKMNLYEYLDHISGKKKEIFDDISAEVESLGDSVSTEVEQKLKGIENLLRNDKNIKYNIKIKLY